MRADYKGCGINRGISRFKGFLTWCVQEDLIDFNPAATIEKKVKEQPRNRVLRDHELGYVQLAIEQMGDRAAPFMMLLHTVTRLNDILALQWKEVVERNDGLELHIASTKASVPHIVPLSEVARRLIPNRPEDAKDN